MLCLLSFAAEDTMGEDVFKDEEIFGRHPFGCAIVTAINDAVTMFGHQKMNDALVM